MIDILRVAQYILAQFVGLHSTIDDHNDFSHDLTSCPPPIMDPAYGMQYNSSHG